MVELFAILAFQLVFEPTICSFMIFVTTYSAFLALHFSTSSCCWLCLGSGSFGRVRISLGHVLDFLLPFLPTIFFVTFTDEGLYALFGMYSLLYIVAQKTVPMFGHFEKMDLP